MQTETTARIRRGKPHTGQSAIMAGKKRFNVLVCGRRFGKTKFGIYLLADREVIEYPTAWFAPVYKDILEVWREVNNTLKPIINRSNIQERRIELITGGSNEFWSLENEDAGRGRKYKRVVLDEAAKAAYLQPAWEQAIRPTLTDYIGDAFFLSTPKGRNYFWRLYQKGVGGEKNWAAWHYPTSANPYIDANEIEAAKTELPADIFRQEYMAEFIDEAGTVFRNLDKVIADIPLRDVVPGHFYTMGDDLGTVNDYTVCTVIDTATNEIVHFDRFKGIS